MNGSMAWATLAATTRIRGQEYHGEDSASRRESENGWEVGVGGKVSLTPWPQPVQLLKRKGHLCLKGTPREVVLEDSLDFTLGGERGVNIYCSPIVLMYSRTDINSSSQ